jgi:hypothetical protein
MAAMTMAVAELPDDVDALKAMIVAMAGQRALLEARTKSKTHAVELQGLNGLSLALTQGNDEPSTQTIQFGPKMVRYLASITVRKTARSRSHERREGLFRLPWVNSSASIRFSMRSLSCTSFSRSRCMRFASSSSGVSTRTMLQAWWSLRR